MTSISTRIPAVLVLASALAGCSYSSLEDDVDPEVTAASITLVPSTPSALASVEITLLMKAGSRANRTVELFEVVLWVPGSAVGSEPLATLAMAFPASFGGEVNEGEQRSVILDNAGTTNQALAALCGQPVEVGVSLAFPDEPGTRALSHPFGLTVGCP